jgi:UDP-N-acetylglucosamine/UDP-N-acetylgalactosamine 4-epimerase
MGIFARGLIVLWLFTRFCGNPLRVSYQQLQAELRSTPRTWLVSGVAGFIGSNLLETLLRLDQNVRGLDDLSSGHRRNLTEVQKLVSGEQWKRFTFVEGTVCDLPTCQSAAEDVDHILHQAALCSVPASIDDPIRAHASNATGWLNILVAARDRKVKSVVYASSSAVYGDDPGLPKIEAKIGEALSPYAVTKYLDELYAQVFARCYGVSTVGLRYFNVFGPRQDPEGAYAAVIPKWIAALIKDQPVHINGDGETTRDFCYIANVVQANLLAACRANDLPQRVFNVALDHRTTLNELFQILKKYLQPDYPHVANVQPQYQPFRPGDVRHSQADTSLARKILGYHPTHGLEAGIVEALNWYKNNL